MRNNVFRSGIGITKKISVLFFIVASLFAISGCDAYKQYMGYNRYDWDDSVSYIDEPHKLTCKQVSTKEAPRLCDGTLISKLNKEKKER